MGLLADWIGPETSQVMSDFGRGLLMTNDFGKGAAYGFQAMDDRRKKKLYADAFDGKNPDAFKALMSEDPQGAMSLRKAREDSLAPLRSVALRAKGNPKLMVVLNQKLQSLGAPALNTDEDLEAFAYQGMKPEDAAPQNSGAFAGTSMDAQIGNILIAAERDPSLKNTPQYKFAVAQYTQPRVTLGPDGRVVTIQPTLPNFGGAQMPQPAPSMAGQPAPQPQGQPSPDQRQTSVPVTGANVSITGDPTPQPIPAEQAARVAMAQSFLQQAPDIIKAIESGDMSGVGDVANPLNPRELLSGIAGSVNTSLGRGARGEIMRRLASGQEALVRALTGAAMTKDEAEMYAQRYAPAWSDTKETMLSKANQLVFELQRAIDTSLSGRRLGPEVLRPTPAPKSQYGNNEAPAPAASNVGTSQDPTVQSAIANARAAIAKGKDPAAVAQRLREYGIDPSLAGLQ